MRARRHKKIGSLLIKVGSLYYYFLMLFGRLYSLANLLSEIPPLVLSGRLFNALKTVNPKTYGLLIASINTEPRADHEVKSSRLNPKYANTGTNKESMNLMINVMLFLSNLADKLIPATTNGFLLFIKIKISFNIDLLL